MEGGRQIAGTLLVKIYFFINQSEVRLKLDLAFGNLKSKIKDWPTVWPTVIQYIAYYTVNNWTCCFNDG